MRLTFLRSTSAAVVIALSLVPAATRAQTLGEQIPTDRAELVIHAPDHLAVSIRNYLEGSWSPPYGNSLCDLDEPYTIFPSLFYTVAVADTVSRGMPIPAEGVTADLTLAWTSTDAGGSIRACEPVTNDLTGRIAVIERGECDFVTKFEHAEVAGALAAVIVNRWPVEPYADCACLMGAPSGYTGFIGIPGVSIHWGVGYALVQALRAGERITATIQPLAGTVSAEPTPPAPPALLLYVSPNPARGSTTVTLGLEEPSRVRLAVYDVLGREAAVLADGAFEPGRHAFPLDSRALPAGAYVARAEVASPRRVERLARTLTLLR